MPRTTDPARPTDATRFRSAVRSGDASAFALLAERYRGDLVVHCSRIVGTEQAARYLTQEVLLRAWHRRATFPTPASLRSWLFRIATTVCLDHLARQHQEQGAGNWTDPGAPDGGLARETVDLAVLVALQHLPIPQRAALVLHDILGWSLVDTAITLETSMAGADRALQLARVTMREHLPDDRMHWQPGRRSTDRR